MNKKYMDFVPAKTVKAGGSKKAETPAVIVQREVSEIEIDKIFEVRNDKKQIASSEQNNTTHNGMKQNGPRKMTIAPRVHFVNTEKVTKRPLSESVAPRKIITIEKEKPSKPVTIIEKPEKNSKMGAVVAVIITIILGAAAGTVAFLLLPN